MLDGALQLQPFMFSRGFARDILLPAADGQPGVIAAPLQWSAHLIASHPIASNTTFAAIQILLGLGLLVGRAVSVSVAASVAWSVGVWWLGEGLGGLTGGHATLLTGAPGAVLVYIILASLAWPTTRPAKPVPVRQRRIALVSWTTLWLLGAVYQLLPGQNTGHAISATITDATAAGPSWLAHAGNWLAGQIPPGTAVAVALGAIQAVIGLLALTSRPTRNIALGTGATLAVAFWVFGQGLGNLSTGQATDPNTGPVIALLAALCWIACRPYADFVSVSVPRARRPARRHPRHVIAAVGSRIV